MISSNIQNKYKQSVSTFHLVYFAKNIKDIAGKQKQNLTYDKGLVDVIKMIKRNLPFQYYSIFNNYSLSQRISKSILKSL